ncbi:MAG: hypothetical protein IPH96_12865 [Saprospiraceae bacterium]|nr:hypothetical protein [Saprospiraceae bacterium]
MTPFPFKGKGRGWVILLAIQFTKYDVGNPTPSKSWGWVILLAIQFTKYDVGNPLRRARWVILPSNIVSIGRTYGAIESQS